jgi:hypothetical protein
MLEDVAGGTGSSGRRGDVAGGKVAGGVGM